jgi:3'-phosphoadenosine 5'-phosphosulfate sulfotransferase (PAPS reductase)/FAD synthetase
MSLSEILSAFDVSMVLKLEMWQLQEKQRLSLDEKIALSILKIEQFVKYLSGNVYISFSGGKDSTVLLDLVRYVRPETLAVFINTGLEYPEIVDFVNITENVTTIRPKMSFYEVIQKYGYPIISKEVSKNISRYRNTKSEEQKRYRLTGVKGNGTKGKFGIIPQKWQFLIDAPFKISDECCNILKKAPIKKFEKISKLMPFVGTMAMDSNRRKINYLQTGCNIVEGKNIRSMPLSFWTDKDIFEYLRRFNISYSKIYDMGEIHTGCMFCMFGCHLEKEPNRFQRMRQTHSKLYSYCINNLQLSKILDYIGVKYE